MIRVIAGFAFVALIIFAAAVGGQAREREALTAAPVSPQARFADWHARHSLVSGCVYSVAEMVEQGTSLREQVASVGNVLAELMMANEQWWD
jgi:hypothetical protein